MNSDVLEVKFPLNFRIEDSKKLGEQLRLRHSVEFVGLKRVGISEFLRFFVNKGGIVQKYIERNTFHIFVSVDLNDLVEKEVFPFWILTFKRLIDSVEKSKLNSKVKKEIGVLFLSAIQSQDIFLTIEYLRESLIKITKEDIYPTIFFIRFDRISKIIDNEIFSNLEGLIDSCHQKLTYVFTSWRNIDQIAQKKLDRNFLHVFGNVIYFKGANNKDLNTIFSSFKRRYKLKINRDIIKKLINICGGHIQYLHLSILAIIQNSNNEKTTNDNLVDIVLSDERIKLQSEEIWESLSIEEQQILTKIHNGTAIKSGEKGAAKYLWDTGLIIENKNSNVIFSILFEDYLDHINEKEEAVELTKKENLLFNLFVQNLEIICDREKIIEEVWPDEVELGVSDWTLDRLVSRLRDKLKKQKSKYIVITIKTRGFKLSTNKII